METTLVIMAAGIGSRFGGGIKQLTPIGPSGEIIMDYSIFDAFEAGFDRILFIIRHDLEADFREIIGNRLEKIFPGKIDYAFQEGDDLPEGFTKPSNRTKPWGTGHAVLACRDVLKTPALVINADDYYGKDGFVKMHDYLVSQKLSQSGVLDIAMPGFILENTLSDNGGVTRGVCCVNEEGYLTEIVETSNIQKGSDGGAFIEEDGCVKKIAPGTPVSMNMWAITPELLPILGAKFKEFLASLKQDDIKSEFLLPGVIGDLVHEKRATVKVLPCADKWFGVTYKEDRESVIASIRALVENGMYRSPLF